MSRVDLVPPVDNELFCHFVEEAHEPLFLVHFYHFLLVVNVVDDLFLHIIPSNEI